MMETDRLTSVSAAMRDKQDARDLCRLYGWLMTARMYGEPGCYSAEWFLATCGDLLPRKPCS